MAASFGRPDATVKIEFELPAAEYSVFDGYIKGSGRTKTAVMREILEAWSKQKHRESIYVVRVAGDNPDAPGTVPSAAQIDHD